MRAVEADRSGMIWVLVGSHDLIYPLIATAANALEPPPRIDARFAVLLKQENEISEIEDEN